MGTTVDLSVEKAKQIQILSNLYNSRYEDIDKGTVVIKCANGTIKAHKTVLTSGSQYFAAMFSYDNEESRTNIIKFDETSVKIMDIIVKHLYNQNLPELSNLTEELTRNLILEADKLQLTELFDQCWNTLNSAITTKNCIHLWELSVILNKLNYIGKVLTFVGNNLTEITQSKAFLDKNASQLSNLITRNLVRELNGTQMAVLFNFILSWGSKKRRMKNVPNLLSKCDLSKLSALFLSDVRKKGVSKEITDLLNNEVIRRWQELITPNYYILAVHVNSNGSCTRHKFSVNENYWIEILQCGSRGGRERYVIVDDAKDSAQWFRECACGDIPIFIQLRSEDNKEEKVTTFFETTNRTCSFFKLLDNVGYLVLPGYPFPPVIFRKFYGDCKRLLLAVENNLYFDVDERSIKIYNWKRKYCKLIDKPPGNWKSFDCPSQLLQNSNKSDINIYFYNENNQLLLFNIQNETWNVDEMSISPNINLNNVKVISCDEAFIVIYDSSTSPQLSMYSLKEKCEIATTCYDPDDVACEKCFYVSY